MPCLSPCIYLPLSGTTWMIIGQRYYASVQEGKKKNILVSDYIWRWCNKENICKILNMILYEISLIYFITQLKFLALGDMAIIIDHIKIYILSISCEVMAGGNTRPIYLEHFLWSYGRGNTRPIYLEHFLWSYGRGNTRPDWWLVNIGSSVQPMLAQFYDAIWCY